MSNKIKRLLCIVGGMNSGGAETFLMKLYRNMDKNKYQMDFCVFNPEKGDYDDEIQKMGGRIFRCTPKSLNPIKSFIDLKQIVKENEFDSVLRISQHSLSAMELLAAKFGSANKTIFRSSNSSTCGGRVNQLIHKVCKPLVKYIPDIKIAPSTEAAEFMFGRNCVQKNSAVILNNAVDVSLFEYSYELRKKIKEELRLEDKFVVGHIGRFSAQKNHKFLIDVFKILARKENAMLVLVGGNGELLEETKEYVKKQGVEEQVLFLGNRSDVNKLLSAFDILVFPSLYEGMPNVVIEAQASGLPCLISDTITREADITGLVKYYSLEKSAKEWATEAILQSKRFERRSYKQELYNAGYTIEAVTEKLIELVF